MDLHIQKFKSLNIPSECGVSIKIQDKIIKLLTDLDLESLLISPNDFYAILDVMFNNLEELSANEAIFKITEVEYEKKELRFIDLTHYSSTSLDQIYFEANLSLNDIIGSNFDNSYLKINFNAMNKEIENIINITSLNTIIFKKRIDLLISYWNDLSKNLLNDIKSFEFHAFKLISSNLRVKIMPVLEDYKSNLKHDKLNESATSRLIIKNDLNSMIEKVKMDVYGDITESQIKLIDNFTNDTKNEELIYILKDPEKLNDFIVLLETEKLSVKISKLIDRLI